MKQELYHVATPTVDESPIVVSSPHSGVGFPSEAAEKLTKAVIAKPEDTDWFVDRLYSFVTELGATLISAEFSRYVIDLNRDPQGHRLYGDSRQETALVPTKSFSGEGLYKRSQEPSAEDIAVRRDLYFDPYHQKIAELIELKKQKFGYAILFDAHSIKKHVPSIQKEPLPDLILGTNRGASCAKRVEKEVFDVLSSTDFDVKLNDPFSGGFITRSFGNPDENIHAVQLEMAQSVYMDESSQTWNAEKASSTQVILRKVFERLLEVGSKL